MAEKYERFDDADTEISLSENDQSRTDRELNSLEESKATVIDETRGHNNDIGPVNSKTEDDMATYGTKYRKLENEKETTQTPEDNATSHSEQLGMAEMVEPYTGLR